MNIADKLVNKFMNSKYVNQNYMLNTIESMVDRERMSLTGRELFFNKNFYKFIPKMLFRHKIFISEQLRIHWDASHESSDWYMEPIKEIISWINDNTKSGAMLVFCDMDNVIWGNYSRVCFLRKEDAAAFKLYFK